MASFHPDLLPAARLVPRFSFTARRVRLMRRLSPSPRPPRSPVVDGVRVSEIAVPGPEAAPAVRVRLLRPEHQDGPVPALLWIHGGGFVIGSPEQDQANMMRIVRELDIAVASVSYRLAPDHPFPAPIEDCYAGLRWLHAEAPTLGVRPDRIAVGGASAGGGLAAGLALLAHDRGELPVAFQLLIYPMLDDRTALRTDIDPTRLRMWNTTSNVFGWTSYLGDDPGGAGTSPYAAPARRGDLRDLAPAWIGVGTNDLFHDEDVAYAARLGDAGVPCELRIVPGAYHAFDRVSAKAPVTQRFQRSYVDALRRALAS